MPGEHAHESADHDAAPDRVPRADQATPTNSAAPENPGLDALAPEMLGNPGMGSRGNTPARVALLQRMQQAYGNRAVQRYMQSMARAAEAQQADPGQADGGLAGLPNRGPTVVQRSLTG